MSTTMIITVDETEYDKEVKSHLLLRVTISHSFAQVQNTLITFDKHMHESIFLLTKEQRLHHY